MTLKRNTYLPIIIMVVVMVIISVLAYQRLSGKSNAPIEGQKTLSATAIRNLDIKTTAADIEVVVGGQDQIVATLGGNDRQDQSEFNVTQDGQTGHIELNAPNSMFNIQLWDEGVTLKVTVPAKDWDQVTVATSSGDITLSDLQAQTLSVESSSGDQHLNGLNIQGQATINSSSGDLTGRNNTMGNAKWQTTSGDVDSEQLKGQQSDLQTSSGDISYVQSELSPNVQLTTSSGDVDVTLTGNTDSLQVQSDSDSGSADVDLDNMEFQNRSEHNVLGTIGQGQAKYHLKVNTSSGDVDISKD